MSAMRLKIKSRAGSTPRTDKPKLTVSIGKDRGGVAKVVDRGDFSFRETYLDAIAHHELTQLLTSAGLAAVPKVRVSCGFPYGMRGSKKFLGQCWDGKAAKDGRPQIFISPFIDDTKTVLATLLHEMIHATLGTDKGHDGDFSRIARQLGFEKPVRGVVIGPRLDETLDDIIRQRGEYPHAKLEIETAEKEGVVKHDSTRLIKLICPTSGYTARTTKKWLDAHGPLISPVTKKVMKVC